MSEGNTRILRFTILVRVQIGHEDQTTSMALYVPNCGSGHTIWCMSVDITGEFGLKSVCTA